MKVLVVCALALAVAGCANNPTLPVNYEQMTADQLKQIVADKNASAACAVVNGPWGKGVVTYVLLDKATFVSGSVTVNNDCSVSIQAAPKPLTVPTP